jgi:apolipoprotein N-acyltransferase
MKKRIWGLSLLSGALLGAAWFPPFTFLIFVAWVPLFMLTDYLFTWARRPAAAVFVSSYIAFVSWNALVTWWTWFASPGGCVAAILANSLLMAFTYWLFFILYRTFTKAGKLKVAGFWWLIPAWLSFEYLHTLWELAWTWLTLGNVFAYTHNWVQWYEFTGVSGGSLWALSANIIVYQMLKVRTQEAGPGAAAQRPLGAGKRAALLAAVVFIPIGASYLIRPSALKTGKAVRQQIVIVQPNIDPYNDKFSSSYESQLQRTYGLLTGQLSQETDYLVFPETFFTENIWENSLEESYSVKFLRDSILKKYPGLTIITGASTFYHYPHGGKLSPTAHKYTDADEYYDVYNTALQLDNYGPIQVYHKSKLVPGVERMPYPAVFGFLEKLAIDLGGTSGSLGTQDEREVFFNKDKTTGVATVICYESIFGEYLADFIRGGANLVFIITNDGWWRNTPGYVQHLNYARLRAIETRVPIARCANTGISCFVDECGELSQETKWWEPAVISEALQPSRKQTFYVKRGDLLSKLALAAAGVGLLGALFLIWRRK